MMNWALAAALMAALAVMVTILGFWRLSESRRSIRDRFGQRAKAIDAVGGIFRVNPEPENSRLKRVAVLTEQAGYDSARARIVLLLMVVCAIVLGMAAWRHTGGIVSGVLSGLVGSSLPYLYLLHKRHKRFEKFEQQFPDALDMMTRSIRAGHALSGAIGLVGEEMPDPVGQEFRRVFEEVRLGLDPGEALAGIQRRVPTEDTGFFYTAISIQRIGGGNLAEILDRLAEVIRERFKLLKQARVLSTQHRWTAICVGLSPFAFALLFALVYPGYFKPLFESPLAPYLLAAGAVLETVGFFSIWRIAKIEV
ncbi:MAG: type II secretion system F family protein [Deltaproteobacteria bacterium]|nr:type II secretion system F family protein [Deltaproteobacteria bacterium]